MPSDQVITFDFYGTLVQWHEGVEAAFREILARHGKPTADPAPLIHAFHTEGRRLRDTPPWKPYAAVLRESLRLALNHGGLAMGAADVEGLIARLGRLPAHPDVPAALAALCAAGFRLAAISNTDDDLIAGSLLSIDLALETVITAQQAGAYKRTRGCSAIRAFWFNPRGEAADAQWLPFTEVKGVAEAARLILR